VFFFLNTVYITTCMYLASHPTYPTVAFACSPDWIGLSSVLRPCQLSIGYMGDSFYRSKEPTNSVKVLKEQIVHRQIKHTISRHEHKTQYSVQDCGGLCADRCIKLATTLLALNIL